MRCEKTVGQDWYLAGLLALLLLGGKVQAEELATVVLAPVVVPEEVIIDGVVEAVHQATVSAQTSGRIQQINFDVNDFVPKGSVIMRFHDTQQQAEVNAAQAALGEAQARLAEAATEHARVEDLFAKQLVARSMLDKASADHQAAEQKTQGALARLAQAQEELEHTLVRAPYDGILVKRHVEVGELAKPGQPLVSGFSLDKLRVTADVSQALITSLRKKVAARILVADKSLAVTEMTIYPFADPQTHTFRVRANFSSDAGGIHPGMFTKVAFTVGERQILPVPAAAVVYRGEVTGVYVVDGQGVVRLRQIRIGQMRDGQIEVLAGLNAGETIALDPIKAGIRRKETSDVR